MSIKAITIASDCINLEGVTSDVASYLASYSFRDYFTGIMGKLRKLRTRFISSIGAVKRSVLRRQSQTSTASNPTTLTRLASVDSAVPARTATARPRGRRAQKQQVRMQSQDPEGNDGEQLQLHWNEARRIYSEPMQTIQNLSASEENRSNAETAAIDTRSQCCAVVSEQLVRKSTSIGSLCTSEQVALEGTEVSDEDDYDDVFLQSWEEPG